MNKELLNDVDVKRLFKWAGMAVLFLAIFLAVETIGALKGLNSADAAYNSISVTGQGESVSIPDIATFSFSVSADASAVSDAQSAVTKKMDVIISALKNLGIASEDIQTSDYSVYPKYTYTQAVCSPTFCPPSNQTQDGYTASHSITVKVRNTNDAGKALSAAGDNGATNISSISFTSDDPELATTEARGKAIENAKNKAKELAKELGVRLVRVTSYEDNAANRPIPMYSVVSQDSAAKAGGVAPSIPVGQNKTSVSVTVTYEIR